MRIAVGTIFFDVREELLRMIESCTEHVDYIFMIDGVIKQFPSNHSLSNDGSRELVKHFHNTILIDAPNLLEHQKRMKYLELCKQFDIDYLLIVDSDEYFHDCDWEKFEEEIREKCKKDYIYNIKNYIYSPITESTIPVSQPRLWRNPGEIEYYNGRHYMFTIKSSNPPVNLTAKKSLYSVKLMHDPHLRSDKYNEQHSQWLNNRIEYEKMQQLIETNKEKAMREESVYAGN